MSSRREFFCCFIMYERSENVRKGPSGLGLCVRFPRCLFIIVAMVSHLQSCVIKACIAARFSAPAMLHTFAPRPAAAALAALRCYVLMCAALTNRKRFVKMSANAHASMAFASAFLAALIILYSADPAGRS